MSAAPSAKRRTTSYRRADDRKDKKRVAARHRGAGANTPSESQEGRPQGRNSVDALTDMLPELSSKASNPLARPLAERVHLFKR